MCFYYSLNTDQSTENQALYILHLTNQEDLSKSTKKTMDYLSTLSFFSTLPENFHYEKKTTETAIIYEETKEGRIDQFRIKYLKNEVILKLINKTWDMFQLSDKFVKKHFKFYIYKPINSPEMMAEIIKEKGNQTFPIYHPYRQFGVKIYDNSHEAIKEHVTKNCYSDSGQYKKKVNEYPPISQLFFNKYGGRYIIFTEKSVLYPMKYTDEGNMFNIKAFVYTVPELNEILTDLPISTIELDCSFMVLAPYVYCIPHAIISNESIPLGLSVGPTESHLIYEQFYEFVNFIDKSLSEKLSEIPVLSDEGSAIQKFCEKYNLQHFLCYRHLINKFGASTPLGGIVRGLLFCQTKEKFEEKWEDNKQSILEQLSITSQIHVSQFEKLFECHYDKKNNTITSPTSTQGMWNRLGSPTCSNHAESAHSHLNDAVSNIRMFNQRLSILMKYIQNRISLFSTRRNLRDALKHLEHLAQVQKVEQTKNCKCKNVFKSSLYGIEFPCIHKILDFPFPPNLPTLHTVRELQFHKVVTDINEEYKEWTFTKGNILPYFKITDDDILLSNVYGKPDVKFIVDICSFLPKIKKINTETLINYITILFIHYSSSCYGYYEYDDHFKDFCLLFITKNITLNDFINQHRKFFLSADERNKNITRAKNVNLRGDITSEVELFTSFETEQRDEVKSFEKELQEIVDHEKIPPKDQIEDIQRNIHRAEQDLQEEETINEAANELIHAINKNLNQATNTEITHENCIKMLRTIASTLREKGKKFEDLQSLF